MSAAKAPNLGIVIAGLLLGILMASMDSTIVATAMGNIVGELGGMDKFVWVTSAYLVAEMAGMPIFGKLSDMYGRKSFCFWDYCIYGGFSALRDGRYDYSAGCLSGDSGNWRRRASADCFCHNVRRRTAGDPGQAGRCIWCGIWIIEYFWSIARRVYHRSYCLAVDILY